MDLTALLTPVFVFAAICYFTALIIRKIVENVWKKAKDFWPWEEVILPTLPVLIGLAIAHFVPSYPFPPEFTKTAGLREMIGAAGGMCSGWIYKIAKAFVKKTWGINPDDIGTPVSLNLPTVKDPSVAVSDSKDKAENKA